MSRLALEMMEGVTLVKLLAIFIAATACMQLLLAYIARRRAFSILRRWAISSAQSQKDIKCSSKTSYIVRHIRGFSIKYLLDRSCVYEDAFPHYGGRLPMLSEYLHWFIVPPRAAV